MQRAWVVALAVSLACGGKLFTIRVDGIAETVIEQGTVVEVLLEDFGFADLANLEISESEELANQNQGVEPGDIEEVLLTDFVLTARDGVGDLSFLDRIDVYVEGPGLPRVLIASSDSFPPGQSEVVFEVTGADITDYAVGHGARVPGELAAS